MTREWPGGVAAAGALFHVEDRGPEDGPCVVMAHSIMTDSGMWRGQAEMLAARGYRAVCYDNRGHGRTRAGLDAGLSRYADDVIALLDAMDIAHAHFVGLSLGGMLGLDLAARHGGRLLSAVICDAPAAAPEGSAALWDARIAQADEQGMAAMVEPTMRRWFGPVFLASAQAQPVRRMIANTPVAGFAAAARAIRRFDYLDVLPGIDIPVSLIVGGNDGALPDAMAAYGARLPNATLRRIDGAGHLPNLEQPQAFDACLLEHLSSGP